MISPSIPGAPVAATGGRFGDRIPTQPLPAGRGRGGIVIDDRPARPPDAGARRVVPAYDGRPPSRHHRAASAGGGTRDRPPARRASRTAGSSIVVVVVLVVVAVIGVLGPQQPWETPTLGEADGVVTGDVTVFDDVPAVAELDPGLRTAIRRAAKDASDDRITFHLNSGWRSRAYQRQLLHEAVSTYGSEAEAARWVATPDTSAHVSGKAADIGHSDAARWLSRHGAAYGLCPIYRNEPWHYELRPDAVDQGCPSTYADPTHDPRMTQ